MLKISTLELNSGLVAVHGVQTQEMHRINVPARLVCPFRATKASYHASLKRGSPVIPWGLLHTTGYALAVVAYALPLCLFLSTTLFSAGFRCLDSNCLWACVAFLLLDTSPWMFFLDLFFDPCIRQNHGFSFPNWLLRFSFSSLRIGFYLHRRSSVSLALMLFPVRAKATHHFIIPSLHRSIFLVIF